MTETPPPFNTISSRTILVLGATGYVGGRLVPRLLEKGYQVRAGSRHLQKVQNRPWSAHPNLEPIAVDVLDRESLKQACTGCQAVFYLVHSMNAQHAAHFESADRQAAQNMRNVAEETGIEQIVYLGGLGEDSPDLSPHLKSRSEVAQILQSGPVPVTYFRAGMIIGSGSASFEILRYLVERLPVMITPRWVHQRCQPIAIRNVLYYLESSIEESRALNETLDIGGSETLTYLRVMEIYAEEAKLPKRWVIPVPVFSPKLSSYWIHLVTPVPSYLAQPLAEGLKNPVVCQNNKAQEIIPQELFDPRQAIDRALQRLQYHQVETHWLDSHRFLPVEWKYPGDDDWSGGTVYMDRRMMTVASTADSLWQPLIRIGGGNGWYSGFWLWKLRGLMDVMMGGEGFSRGRKHPERLQTGDFVDCFRVVQLEEPGYLLLKAEMKVPGEAYLEFCLNENEETGQTELVQTARFIPAGLIGILYWWAVTPFHHFVFNGMMAGFAHKAEVDILAPPTRTD